MPIGIIIDSSLVLIGGGIGAFACNILPKKVLNELPSIFGLSAMVMGIVLIVKMQNLTPIILALILGAIIGELLNLENRLIKMISKITNKVYSENFDDMETLVIVIVLFCFSGTGIFGALNEGFSGESSVMITKSVLDFFTAITFGVTLGYLVSFIAIPQFIISLILFFSAGIIVPILSDGMLLDFKACGGIITFAAGLKLSKIKSFNIINLIPAIIIVIPLSYFWSKLF